MRVFGLVCFISGLGLIIFATNAKQSTNAPLRPRKIVSSEADPSPRATSISENKNFSVAKPNAPSQMAAQKRTIASTPSYTVEPGEFRYDRDSEKRDYIEEGVSLEDIEREKNQ